MMPRPPIWTSRDSSSTAPTCWADLRITNFGGGNTSAKVEMKDPLTVQPVTVLWVKGSGGDIGSMKLDGFATLYMDKLDRSKVSTRASTRKTRWSRLNHCTFDLNPRAPSIDTCLHGYVPYPHVDHVHSDAVIAIAASEGFRTADEGNLRRRDGLSALAAPRHRPRHQARRMAKNPQFVGVVLGSHGLFTWGRTAKECYDTTLRIINKAAVWLERTASSRPSRAPRPFAPRCGSPRRGAAPDAGDPRPHLEARAQDRPFR
jgi:rhamnose utilization protein RhaD (predicted bifunctional aldolase and dehydrogenase)